MALLYDSFSVRRLTLKVLLFPNTEDRFPEGLLSQLYAAINTDDTFDDCSLRQRLGAIFEGEGITYEINAQRVEINMRTFEGILDAKERVRQMLATTKTTLPFRFVYLRQSVDLWGLVPDDKAAQVIDKTRTKTLKLTRAHFSNLPGHVMGTGINVVGHKDDEFSYDVTIAPYLREPENLYLEGELTFGFPDEVPDNDIDDVLENLQTAYDFLANDVNAFARSFMP